MMWPYILNWVLLLVAFIFNNSVFAQDAKDEDSRTYYDYDLHYPMVFNCSKEDVSVTKYDWTINGTEVSAAGSEGVRLEEGGLVLRVLRATEADFGEYTCSVGAVEMTTWWARARPHAALPPDTVAAEGAAFELTCDLVGRPYEAVSWTYTRPGSEAVPLAPGADERVAARASPQGVPGAVLRVARAERADHGAVYTCVPPRGGVPASTTLRVTSEVATYLSAKDAKDEDSRTYYDYDLHYPMVFNCSKEDVSVTKYDWTINGTEVSAAGSEGVRLEEGGLVLRVLRATEADFGEYTCSVGAVEMTTWWARARPHAALPPDTVAAEGAAFELTCDLVGRPYEAVSWTYTRPGSEAVPLAPGADERVAARASPQGVPGAVLRVARAERADHGAVYTCVPPRGGVPASTTLRVTAPPAAPPAPSALWPFLGICLEVVVLCAIILVYEKRRESLACRSRVPKE